jgi:DNA-binding MarR family transcriptional regulator
MQSRRIPTRSAQIDYVASELMPRAALLTRLLLRQVDAELSRTELGLLRTLSDGPRRITELAELEGLAQPTMTILIKQLEHEGLVRRERRSDDGRVVLVDLTENGRDALEAYRERVTEAIGEYLAEISDEQVDQLAAATETLAELVTLLQQQPTGSR